MHSKDIPIQATSARDLICSEIPPFDIFIYFVYRPSSSKPPQFDHTIVVTYRKKGKKVKTEQFIRFCGTLIPKIKAIFTDVTEKDILIYNGHYLARSLIALQITYSNRQ